MLFWVPELAAVLFIAMTHRARKTLTRTLRAVEVLAWATMLLSFLFLICGHFCIRLLLLLAAIVMGTLIVSLFMRYFRLFGWLLGILIVLLLISIILPAFNEARLSVGRFEDIHYVGKMRYSKGQQQWIIDEEFELSDPARVNRDLAET